MKRRGLREGIPRGTSLRGGRGSQKGMGSPQSPLLPSHRVPHPKSWEHRFSSPSFSSHCPLPEFLHPSPLPLPPFLLLLPLPPFLLPIPLHGPSSLLPLLPFSPYPPPPFHSLLLPLRPSLLSLLPSLLPLPSLAFFLLHSLPLPPSPPPVPNPPPPLHLSHCPPPLPPASLGAAAARGPLADQLAEVAGGASLSAGGRGREGPLEMAPPPARLPGRELVPPGLSCHPPMGSRTLPKPPGDPAPRAG